MMAARFLAEMDAIAGMMGTDDAGDEGDDDSSWLSMAAFPPPGMQLAGAGMRDPASSAAALLGAPAAWTGTAGVGALAGVGMLGSSASTGGLRLPGLAGAGVPGTTAAGLGGLGALLNAPIAGAAGAPSLPTRQNAQTVASIANQVGVDPTLAVAMMLVESSGNNRAIGDNGTSFGLFQLHQGGMLTSAGLTPDQAFDPATNARVALTSLAHEVRKGPNRPPGEIAAASQRPADPAGYAAKIHTALPQARALLGG